MVVTVGLRGRWRSRPALVTDLPVLLVLIAAWLLVPVAWAHISAGLGLAAVVLVHLRTRRGLARRVLRMPRAARRAATWATSWIVLAAVTAVSGTGLLRLVGVGPEETWHGGTGYVLVSAVSLHLWLVRHRLSARLRDERSVR